MRPESSALDECAVEEVEVGLHWRAHEGQLRGSIVIENRSTSDCRISGRPTVVPLDVDGVALPVEQLVSLEMRQPDFVVVAPGEAAFASVGWNEFPPACEAGGQALVQWGQPPRRVLVRSTGPVRPDRTGHAATLWTSWFSTSPT